MFKGLVEDDGLDDVDGEIVDVEDGDSCKDEVGTITVIKHILSQ